MSVNHAVFFFGLFSLLVGMNYMVFLVSDYIKERHKKAEAKAKINEKIFKTFKHREKDKKDDDETKPEQ